MKGTAQEPWVAVRLKEATMNSRRRIVLGIGSFALVVGVSAALADGPHAHNPLTIPFFSIDRTSPSIGGANNLHADDILKVPGPIQVVNNVNLGLGRPGDELDELSGSRDPAVSIPSFSLLFSVDRLSVGAVPPDPGVVSMGYPYNVQQQAVRNQAAGDLYMSTALFSLSGPLPSPRAIFNHTMVINQGDAGGVDFQLDPPNSPDDFISGAIDDLDGVGYSPGLRGTLNQAFFSLSSDSPSLKELSPVLPSGANIYFDQNTGAAGGEQLFVSAAKLGLQAADDVDAFVVFDNGNGIFEDGIDTVLFSLRRNSPTLALLGLSSADVLKSNGAFSFSLLASAAQLGLLGTDELDALELLPCADINVCINERAIFPEPATAMLIIAGVAAMRRRNPRRR